MFKQAVAILERLGWMPLLAGPRFGQSIKLFSLHMRLCQHMFCKYRSPTVIWYLLGNVMNLLMYEVVISVQRKGNMSVVNDLSYSMNCLFWVTGIFLNYYPDMMLCVIWSFSAMSPSLTLLSCPTTICNDNNDTYSTSGGDSPPKEYSVIYRCCIFRPLHVGVGMAPTVTSVTLLHFRASSKDAKI